MPVTFDVVIKKEFVGTGDGATSSFYTKQSPVEAGTFAVYVDGVEQIEGMDYSMTESSGTITFYSGHKPSSGSIITIDYTWEVGLSLEISSMSIMKKSKSKVIAIPYRNHVLIPLGKEGPTYTVEGMFSGDTTFDKFNAIDPEMYLKITATTYPEFEVGEYWMVNQPKITRKGGMCSSWVYTTKIVKEWYM